MRRALRFVLSAAASAALTLSTVGLTSSYAAETAVAPVAVTEEPQVPEACTIDEAADTDDAEVSSEHHGSAMPACVKALRDAGEHGYGQSVSAFAHELNEARKADREEAQAESKPGKDKPAEHGNGKNKGRP